MREFTIADIDALETELRGTTDYISRYQPIRSLFGMDIVEAPVNIVHVLKLRDDAPVTSKFREEFNAWLLEMFGTRDASVVPKGYAFMFGNTVVMLPSDVVKLSSCVC